MAYITQNFSKTLKPKFRPLQQQLLHAIRSLSSCDYASSLCRAQLVCQLQLMHQVFVSFLVSALISGQSISGICLRMVVGHIFVVFYQKCCLVSRQCTKFCILHEHTGSPRLPHCFLFYFYAFIRHTLRVKTFSDIKLVHDRKKGW